MCYKYRSLCLGGENRRAWSEFLVRVICIVATVKFHFHFHFEILQIWVVSNNESYLVQFVSWSQQNF